MKNIGFIYDRGGLVPLGVLDGEVRIQWDRRRDDVSEATITVLGMSSDCCAMLSEVRAVRHEIVIVRNGERVWEGPITHIAMSSTGGTIRARDVLFFAQRTVCKKKWSSAYIPDVRPRGHYTTERFELIARDEMAEWEKAGARFLENLDVRTTSTTSRTTKVKLPYSQYVWDDLDDMAARSGLDYTVVGRRLIVHDTHELIAQGRELTDSDFLEGIEMSEYGIELAVVSYVTDNAGNAGISRLKTPDTYYGPIELLHGAYGLGDGGGEDGYGAPLAPVEPTVPLRANYPTAAQRKSVEERYAKDPAGLKKALDAFARNYDTAVKEYPKDLAAYQEAMRKFLPVLAKYVEGLTDQAVRNHEGRYPAPALIRVPQNSRLTPPSVDELWEWLVPGTGFMVHSTQTCRELNQLQKLDRVTVREDSNGEAVTVILSTAPGDSSFIGEAGDGE